MYGSMYACMHTHTRAPKTNPCCLLYFYEKKGKNVKIHVIMQTQQSCLRHIQLALLLSTKFHIVTNVMKIIIIMIIVFCAVN